MLLLVGGILAMLYMVCNLEWALVFFHNTGSLVCICNEMILPVGLESYFVAHVLAHTCIGQASFAFHRRKAVGAILCLPWVILDHQFDVLSKECSSPEQLPLGRLCVCENFMLACAVLLDFLSFAAIFFCGLSLQLKKVHTGEILLHFVS